VALEIQDDGGRYVEVGAGCSVDRVLEYLASHGGYTLPVYGIIGKQTIAGAISTATHGSGRASLSHYVTAVVVAAYDGGGEPTIYEWNGGEELRAARCGLGCTGILLSVRVRVEPDYLIEETTRWFDHLDDVLECSRDYPRQQFYLVPWSWKWLAQLRRPLVEGPGVARSAMAGFHRVVRLVVADVFLNGAVRLLSGPLRWRSGIRWFNRRMLPVVTRFGGRVVDRSRYLLQMRHDLYRHVEMELFVPARHIRHAAAFVEWLLRWCGGESPRLPEVLRDDDFGCDVSADIHALKGCYVHDYLVTFRRVLGDDTLISMSSGDAADTWYAISLLSYQRDLGPYSKVARFMAAAMAAAYGARPHWGKICPLTTGEIAALYPELPRFRARCASVDANQVFVNDFARQKLGFQDVRACKGSEDPGT
jgi:FAD/FMN-containing dehydrogenase